MSAYYRLNLLASTYGSGSYNTSNYDGTNSSKSGTDVLTSGGGSSSGASGGGGLSDTGIAIAGIVTLACLILLVAMVVRIWRRPPKHVAQSDEN